MASDLGVAILKFIAHTEELEKGCKKAEKVSESTFKRMGKDAAGFGKSFGKHLGSAFAGIGKSAVMGLSAGVGIELTQGLEAIVSKSFDRIEKLASFGKLSRQLQLDSSEFSGFAGLVENEVGIETDRFAKALRNLSEASLKTDENTTRLFKNIGINQQEFAQLNPLQQYAELMSKLGDNGVDDELAVTELLSEKLSDLGEHISMSREELEKQAKAYQRSNEQIAKAWVANDQLEQSNKELSIAFDKLVESITPGINMIADQLPGAIDALTGQFTNLDGTVDSTMKKAIVEFAGWIDHVQLAREAVSGLGKDITEAFGGDKNSKWGMDRINANLAGSFGWFTSQTGKLIGNDVLKQEGDFIQQDSMDWIRPPQEWHSRSGF
jgi:hypothetical protein